MLQPNPLSIERIYRDDTLEDYQHGIERAIEVMDNQLGETLTIEDLADSAFMSKFHFSRVFAKITGVSPARFLAAIRIQEAKRLLLKTDNKITDICLDVGYNSLGTFTRIFADFVGFPPRVFRQLAKVLCSIPFEEVLDLLTPAEIFNFNGASIAGEIKYPAQFLVCFVGVFPNAIPNSFPAECCILREGRNFAFAKPVAETVYVHAAALLQTATLEDAILSVPGKMLVGSSCHSSMANGTLSSITLKNRGLVEPPVVVAFALHFAIPLILKTSNLGEEFCQLLTSLNTEQYEAE